MSMAPCPLTMRRDSCAAVRLCAVGAVMTVFADTSPLNYLILIGEVQVLPRLFGEVIIPTAVMTELFHPKAPAADAKWAVALPDWVKVK